MTNLSTGQKALTLGHATWFGKMCRGHSQAIREKTSEPSSKKQRKSVTKPPLYLNLLKENGTTAEPSWETGGALLGEYSTPNFGESPSAAVESTLSQILEATPPEKYYLSETACRGILRRAESRGKELPPILKDALMRQAGLMVEEVEEDDLESWLA